MQTFGRHLILELSGCSPEIISDLEKVREYMIQAAIKAGAEVRTTAFHRFRPQGVSGVVVIAESHLSLHTWPEYGYVALDIYTCGDTTEPWRACEFLADCFQAKEIFTLSVKSCLLYTSPSPRDLSTSRMPSSA